MIFCDVYSEKGFYYSLIWKELSENIHKDIFACLFSIHNMISLSCHEQVGVYFWGLGFKKAWVALYYTTSNFILSNEI